MATGRRPSTEAWHSIGLALTEREWLNVDRATLEAQPGVFGAGDVTGLGGFTHPAYYHGQVAAQRLRGLDTSEDFRVIQLTPPPGLAMLGHLRQGRDSGPAGLYPGPHAGRR